MTTSTETSAAAEPGGLFSWLGGSIRRKLILTLGLVAVVPLLITALVSSLVTSRTLQQQGGASIAATASETADLVSQTLVENVHLVESLAGVGTLVDQVSAANSAPGYLPANADPLVPGQPMAEDQILSRLSDLNEDWKNTPPYLRDLNLISSQRNLNPAGFELTRFQERFPAHNEILITDRRGALLAATNHTEQFFFGEEPWFSATLGTPEGQIYIGRPAQDVDTGVPRVLLGLPVRDEVGQAIGAVASSLDIREIIEILRQIRLGETGIVTIYDPNGIGIFDPQNEGLGSSAKPARLELTGQGSDRIGGQIYGQARPSRTAGIGAIEELGWTAVARQDASEALRASNFARLLQLGIALLVALLAVAAAFALARLLTRQIDHITDLFEDIRQENYIARAEVVSSDELGRMTLALNDMLDNTLSLIQSKQERDSIQQSVVKLLEEVAGVAQGDLRARAEVTPDVTGAIADSFNYMIVQLRRIIGDVQDTTAQVNNAAETIRGRMDALQVGSDSQARQIGVTGEQIQEMTASIQEVSRNAERCARVADDARENARQGADAVEKTIHGMQSIRGQVREATKRLKRLAESSQEIGEIVKLIGEISDRTNILALNASLQAAAAGEAGQSFAVVADEIERLAERSAEASQRIGTLIQTVQVETAEAMGAMESTTQEVLSGSQVANGAGQALTEIEGVSVRLADLVQAISEAARQQARSSQEVARAMRDISGITSETTSGTRLAASAAGELSSLAENLRNSVRRFQLPSPAKVA